MSEEWRPVVGSGGLYEVSNLGRVRSFVLSPTPKLRALHPDANGYSTVKMRVYGKRITARVHVLVLAAFVGPRPPGEEVRHLDGDPTNNRLSNLAYGTRSQNARDAIAHGTNRESRKTHCVEGHPYDEANTFWRTGEGGRACRACRAARNRAYRARQKAMAS